MNQVQSFLKDRGLRITELVYSSDRDGIVPSTLLHSWHHCSGPVLFLLIRKPPRVLGAFLEHEFLALAQGVTDSASVLFQAGTQWEAWEHQQGQKLQVELSAEGLSVGRALGLAVPVVDGWWQPSEVFGNSALEGKQSFGVFFVELWQVER